MIDITSAASVLFLDLQENIVTNSKTVAASQLRIHAAALAKLAALHELPVFASSVPPGGAYLSEVLSALPALAPRPRTQTSAFVDDGLVASLKATGRTTLILSGVASEIVVQRTALDAIEAGFKVQVAVDASGGVSSRTEDAAWRRLLQAGGVTTSVTTIAAELAGDFTTPLGAQTLAIMYETLGS
jgi:nicotinamidase-related amidase